MANRFKTAVGQALHDIAEDFKGVKNTRHSNGDGTFSIDTWFVHEGYLYNKESRRLNRELGLSYLNQGGWNRGKKKGEK